MRTHLVFNLTNATVGPGLETVVLIIVSLVASLYNLLEVVHLKLNGNKVKMAIRRVNTG